MLHWSIISIKIYVRHFNFTSGTTVILFSPGKLSLTQRFSKLCSEITKTTGANVSDFVYIITCFITNHC